MVGFDLNRCGGRNTLYLLIFLVAVWSAGVVSNARAGHDEPRLIIIGDSLSTTHESWPNYLRGMAPRWNVHVHAQAGRTIRDYDPPRDLWTSGAKPDTVIYFLGAADALQGSDITYAKYRLRNHLSFLLDRNFKVVLVNLPVLETGDEQISTLLDQYRALIESFRGSYPGLWVYDVNQIWNPDNCPDGIHPDAELSYKIAEAINWVLAVNIH